VNSESLLASVVTAATRTRARPRDTPLVAFLLGVDPMGPGDGYEPAEGDGVWDLAVSISECRSRSSADLDHCLDRAEASALPDTHTDVIADPRPVCHVGKELMEWWVDARARKQKFTVHMPYLKYEKKYKK
jgi:hypothetical protein